MDKALGELDGSRLTEVGLGDELGDRDGAFEIWSKSVMDTICGEAKVQFNS